MNLFSCCYKQKSVNSIHFKLVIMMITMPLMKLHLNYRLFIAQMNSDIEILRIFEDYTKEIFLKRNEPEVKQSIDYFNKSFINLKKENEEIRNEMHLKKMKLFAFAKQDKKLGRKTFKDDNYAGVLKEFKLYKKKFDRLKKEFVQYVGNKLK